MSLFTKISEIAQKPLLIALMAFMAALAPSFGRAGVIVRVTTEATRGGAFAREHALDSAITAAVSVIIGRHVPLEQRTDQVAKLKAILSSAQNYVNRYAILSEGLEDNLYRMKLDADVDRESLLRALEKEGFTVMRLDALPRMLLSTAPDPASRAFGSGMEKLFKGEGISASLADAPEGGIQDMASYDRALVDRGYHVGVTLSLAKPVMEVPADGPMKPGEGTAETESGKPEAAMPAPGEKTEVEYAARLEMVDARDGRILGREEFAVMGEGADEAAVYEDAAERASEQGFQLLMADLVRSGFRIGSGEVTMEIHLVGIELPGAVAEMSEVLASMSEFRSVTLKLLEFKSATWSVVAVDSGNDWLSVLTRAQSRRASIAWKKDAGGGKLAFTGKWTAR